jgi:hypothetical protein
MRGIRLKHAWRGVCAAWVGHSHLVWGDGGRALHDMWACGLHQHGVLRRCVVLGTTVVNGRLMSQPLRVRCVIMWQWMWVPGHPLQSRAGDSRERQKMATQTLTGEWL